MRGYVIAVEPGLAAIAGEWEDLAERTSAPPWLRPRWYAAWRRAFGRGAPEMITVRREGRLAGVVPMQRLGSRLRSPSNFHTPAFGLLGEDAEAAHALARAVFARPAREVGLKFLPADGPALDACLAAAGRSGRVTIVRTVERSPVVDSSGSWDAYRKARRGHLVRELRRRGRRLDELGQVEVAVEDGRTDLERLLAEGFAVERSGWKGARGTAMASRPATRRFYTDVARWTAECGWLRLAFLRLDGRAIAFDFAFEHDRVQYLLKTGYDATWARFAPGMLLRQEMLRRAFASPVERYEFLGHDDPWKLEWADETADQVELQAFSRSPAGLVECAVHAWGPPVAQRARPALRRIAVAIRARRSAARGLTPAPPQHPRVVSER